MARVVSLLPSATEILCTLRGGSRLLVGRSHEDNFPQSIGHLPVSRAAPRCPCAHRHRAGLTGQRDHVRSSLLRKNLSRVFGPED